MKIGLFSVRGIYNKLVEFGTLRLLVINTLILTTLIIAHLCEPLESILVL